ncbi:hypothetical protein CAPTEDRAFT_159948 [Capitella teleta]|uniref:Homeobox domain-containing protein n=2 Tax=Capitella teleta TaxID=283909 RepID=R7UP44_CAPTE|nr:hypothetical protein CAPTEDRAFT_159948 [Capitella teleta]|eukprot:ELU07970.1 hypothetical protein CAPTEDRAFT_159948 [Capitella teleta]
MDPRAGSVIPFGMFPGCYPEASPVSSVLPHGLFPRRRRKESSCRRQRTTFTSEQTLKLELEYQRMEYITRPRRFELAELLNLTETQIKIWYQNRRAKDKRIEKAQMDQHFRVLNLSSSAQFRSAPPVSASASASDVFRNMARFSPRSAHHAPSPQFAPPSPPPFTLHSARLPSPY